MPGASFTLLIRAIDAGATYISFRWLDDPNHPTVRRLLPETHLRRLTALLNEALIGDDDSTNEVKRAIRGPLGTLGGERSFTTELSEIILDDTVVSQIVARATRGEVTIEYTPSPAISRVPLDLLPIGSGDRRLMEIAEFVCVPPVSLVAGRARQPDPRIRFAPDSVLYIVDPEVPNAAGLRQVLPQPAAGDYTNADCWAERIAATKHATMNSGVRKRITRWRLHQDLITWPSRLMYVGHVSSTLQQPGSASLHLSCEWHEWGLAAGIARAHRPLSALDLLYGTVQYPHAGPSGRMPPVRFRNLAGHELWPMPPRVAMIACEGGVDYRSDDIFGLVTASMNSGAELVTTTRWTLPSDDAVQQFGYGDDCGALPGPTTELGLAVDEAHQSSDPVAWMNNWQRAKLECWRETGHRSSRHSPLVWASITDHVCAPREDSHD